MPRYIMETGKLSMVPPLKGASHWQQHAGQCRQTANEVKKRGLPGRVRLEYVKNLVRFSFLRRCGVMTLVSSEAMPSEVPPEMPAMPEVAEVPAAESEVKE